MRFLSTICMMVLPASLAAHDYSIADLKVMHPFAFETSQTAQTGAGYLTVMNTGDVADRLLAVEADFPRVMVHDTIIENEVSKMVHLDGIDLAPGETVTLAPGGKHVMFMGLNGDPFEVGEEIPATLVFENAGRLEVVFNVEERAEGHDHGHGDDDKEGHDDHSGH